MTTMNKFSLRLLPPDFTPSENDVICGRGKQFVNHSGNKRFKDIIAENVERYVAEPSKPGKGKIVMDIVRKIRWDSPNGGFIDSDENSGRWYEIGDMLAREKVGHALRFYIKTSKKYDGVYGKPLRTPTKSSPPATKAKKLPLKKRSMSEDASSSSDQVMTMKKQTDIEQKIVNAITSRTQEPANKKQRTTKHVFLANAGNGQAAATPSSSLASMMMQQHVQQGQQKQQQQQAFQRLNYMNRQQQNVNRTKPTLQSTVPAGTRNYFSLLEQQKRSTGQSNGSGYSSNTNSQTMNLLEATHGLVSLGSSGRLLPKQRPQQQQLQQQQRVIDISKQEDDHDTINRLKQEKDALMNALIESKTKQIQEQQKMRLLEQRAALAQAIASTDAALMSQGFTVDETAAAGTGIPPLPTTTTSAHGTGGAVGRNQLTGYSPHSRYPNMTHQARQNMITGRSATTAPRSFGGGQYHGNNMVKPSFMTSNKAVPVGSNSHLFSSVPTQIGEGGRAA